MLVEYTKQTFRAVERLEILKTSSVLIFSYNLGLGGSGSLESLFLFFKYIYKFSHNLLEFLEMLSVLNIINRSTSQLVERCL